MRLYLILAGVLTTLVLGLSTLTGGSSFQQANDQDVATVYGGKCYELIKIICGDADKEENKCLVEWECGGVDKD